MNIHDMLERALRPLRVRLAQMLLKSVTLRVAYDGELPVLQVMVDGLPAEDVEYYETYGVAVHPLRGSQPLLAAIGANRGHTVAAGVVDARYRKRDLQPGEVALYSWKGGYLHFKNDDEIEIAMPGGKITAIAPDVTVVATTKVRMETPLVECTQDMTVGGKLTVTGEAELQAGLDVTGESNFDGGVHATGNIETDADVVIQGRGQLGHVHPYGYPNSGAQP